MKHGWKVNPIHTTDNGLCVCNRTCDLQQGSEVCKAHTTHLLTHYHVDVYDVTIIKSCILSFVK